MHRMLDEKKRRQEQIEGDEKELARLDDVIDNHVQTQLVRTHTI